MYNIIPILVSIGKILISIIRAFQEWRRKPFLVVLEKTTCRIPLRFLDEDKSVSYYQCFKVRLINRSTRAIYLENVYLFVSSHRWRYREKHTIRQSLRYNKEPIPPGKNWTFSLSVKDILDSISDDLRTSRLLFIKCMIEFQDNTRVHSNLIQWSPIDS